MTTLSIGAVKYLERGSNLVTYVANWSLFPAALFKAIFVAKKYPFPVLHRPGLTLLAEFSVMLSFVYLLVFVSIGLTLKA